MAALVELRRKAKSLRSRAAVKDLEAEAMRKEFAAMSTEELPLFQQKSFTLSLMINGVVILSFQGIQNLVSP